MWQKLKYLLLISGLIVAAGYFSQASAADRLFAAQYLAYQYSVRAQGMGLYGIAIPQDNQVSLYNPAMPGFDSNPVGSCYFGKYFWDDTVSSIGVEMTKPSDPVGVGLQLMQCYIPGIERYSANDMSLGVISAVQRYFVVDLRRKLDENFTAGVALGCLGESYDIYNYSSAVLNFGITTKISEALTFGVVINNITASQIASSNIATSLETGIAYHTDAGIVSAEFIYINNLVKKLNLGAEVILTKDLAARVGFNNGELRCGMGLTMGRLCIDYGFRQHVLGDLHLVSVSFLL